MKIPENNPVKYSASPIQRQFWLAGQLNQESPAHNIPSVFRIKGKLNPTALERGIKEIARRHEIFRTTFSSEKGSLQQIIAPDTDITLTISTAEQNNQDINALVRNEINRPFNLEKGPLLRCTVLKLGHNDYILITVMHHIITDLRAQDLFFRELSSFYNAFDQDRPSELNKPKAQYSDYVEWCKLFEQDGRSTQMLSFWEKLLENKNKFLNFPTEMKRPPVRSLLGDAYPIEFSKIFTEKLKKFSQQNNTDIFLTLLTAYIILLGRYSNQENFMIGVPLTNRRNADHKNTMGCFVNILPIPVDLSGNPDFQTVVRRIRITLLNIHRNQEVSFESISNKIGQNRDTSYNPFFQTGFTFEHPRELYLDNLEVKFIQNHPNGSQLDLFLIFLESNGCITGHFEYSTQLFSASAIKRFSESYLSFLTGVMKNPEKPVALQPILSEKEKHKILCQWNDTNKEYTEPHILHKIFENQVIKTPDATAIKYKNKELTYAEFNSKSNQLTGYLKDSGIKTGTYIGIYMDRSIEMAIAIYGIIKAGCVYVPFDPEFPSKRILFMYEDTRVPIFLTQKHLKEKLPSTQAEIICLDSEWETIANFPDTNIDTAITPDDPAYVIFTSGSTGRPKGVENTHRGICNRLLWMQDEYGLTEFDSVIQKTPYSFDVSVWEFFWPLFTGARLVISPPDTHKDPAELIHIINENKITTIHFVPSMLHLFIENQDASTCTTLKRVICSGEALQNDTRKKFFSCMNAELHNLYGPTEAAVDVTYWDCAKETKADIVPIGYPVANTRIYILDKFLNPVPTGVQGELHIGGVQIASGYLNRPELTEEKFIRDPFSDDPQARMYKTGDITHYLPDGTIEYLGRMDHQVKMSGLRIELGEIESVLCDHPSVGQAAVTLNEFSSNDKRLIAYIVPDKKTAYPSLRLIQIQKDPDSNKKVHDLPNGMSIFCQNKSEADFMYREIFTESQYTKNGILLGPGACVFDVGANIGMFTLFISTMIPEATVYSFEPIPAIYDTLSLNVSLCKSNIKTIPMGLSDKPGREEFTYYRDISIISGRYADAVEEKHIIRSHLLHGQQIGKTEYDDLSKEAIENLLEEKLKTKKYNCELTTISDVIQKEKLNKIDLLKIDAEKSEQDVLNGIADPDWKKINQMVIEIHGGSSRLEKMTTMLESRGYSIKIEKDNALEDTELYLVYAIRTDYAESLSESVNLDNSKIEFNWSQSAFTNDVRTYLSKKLPAHMVPSVFTLLEELPLTSNGKIDRKLLPQPEIKESSKVYVKPRTRLEKILSGLWKNILQVDNISITDNFFEIGGTSLLCVKFVSTLQKELDKKIPIVKVFQYPTVSSLSEYFEKRDMMENSLLESSKSRAELRKKVRYKKYK